MAYIFQQQVQRSISMKFISTKTHGILDYLVSALLIGAPWLFGFYSAGAESWVFVIQGLMVILYSLFTDYELGAIRVLNMRVHIALDLAGATALLTSPWLFGFASNVYKPHVAFALLEILLIAFSQVVPKDREILHRRSRPFPFRSVHLRRDA